MMQERPKPSKTPSWLFVLFVLFAVGLGVAGWQFDRWQQGSAAAARYKELTAIGQLKVDQIVAWRHERLAGVSALADWPLFAETVEAWLAAPTDARRTAAAKQYLTVTRRDIGYADVLLADKDGRILLSAVDQPERCGAILQSAVAEAFTLRRGVLTDFHTCDGQNRPYIEAVAPLVTAQGHVVAALVIRSDPATNLYPLLRLWPSASRTGETQLVRRDRDGVRFLNDLPDRQAGPLQVLLPFSETKRPAVAAALGHVGRFDGLDSRGRPILADLRPVPGSPWLIVVKMDVEEAIQEAREHTRLTAALVSLAILLLGVLLAYLSRRRQRDVYRSLYEAEARFRTLVENAGEAVFVQTNSRFAYLNPAALRLLGASADQLLGTPVVDRFHPADIEGVRERIRRLNEDQQSVPLTEERMLRLDGRAVPVEISAAPILYEGQQGAVVFARDVSERNEAQRALRESEEYYRTLFEQSPFPVWLFDAESLQVLAANATACRQYGYTKEEFTRLTARDLRPAEEVRRFDDIMRGLSPTTAVRVDATKHRKKDGTVFEVEVASQEVTFHDRPARIVVINDVTERRRLEQQLQQSQKMEAIGQLAGGIAHDFNNLLTVINNSADLARSEAGAPPAVVEYLEAIADAGERAARLTSQLLAFSRKQVRQPRLVDIDEMVRTIDPMLRRLLGEDIHLVTVTPGKLPPVLADSSQVEQVIVNLAVNARDAMPDGGKLTIETGQAELDEAYARSRPEVAPGRYVVLSVTDNGRGMDEQTQARAFEPFFTTKPAGRGTGLGLSTVYGIVKQNGGHIGVYSEPGQGTTFKVYLPEATGTASRLEPAPSQAPAGGSETVLVVEDERQVRQLAKRILEQAGYTVLAAASASEALALVTGTATPLHAVITDVVMPEMSGRQLAERLCALRPELKVLYMSGYTPNAIVHHGVLDPGIAFIGKPFTAPELRRRLREVLDQAVQ